MEIFADSNHPNLYVDPSLSSFEETTSIHTHSIVQSLVRTCNGRWSKRHLQTPPCAGFGVSTCTVDGRRSDKHFQALCLLSPRLSGSLDCSCANSFCRFVASALPGVLGWSSKLLEASRVDHGIWVKQIHCSRLQDTAVVLGGYDRNPRGNAQYCFD